MDGTVIRDAACLIVVDVREEQPRLLMGRRHADQIFLPDKWVFPGGRVDACDLDASVGHDFARDVPCLLKPFARAAVRELQEETGFSLAASANTTVALTPVARAITPPGRVRRYDTWFFMAPQSALAPDQTAGDGELLDLAWFTIAEARNLDLPSITRLVLEDVSALLRAPTTEPPQRIPFYYQGEHGFVRDVIDVSEPPAQP